MSSYNYSEEYKKNINNFINQLNLLMRESNVKIDFMDGALYYDQRYIGILDDQDTTILLEDEGSLVFYESPECNINED